MTTIKADRRDITFDFDNSRSCCCGLKKLPLKSTTKLYINSGGVAERFDHSKSNNKMEALRRSVSNLNLVIEYNAHLSKMDVAQAHSQVVQAIGNSLDEENPTTITIGLIQRINAAIQEIF